MKPRTMIEEQCTQIADAVVPDSVPPTTSARKTPRDSMNEWRWDVEENAAGNIVGIVFSGEKAGDDLILFKAIAPFVKSGSYIEMHGEDGAQWRWIFNEKTCGEKTAKVSWD